MCADGCGFRRYSSHAGTDDRILIQRQLCIFFLLPDTFPRSAAKLADWLEWDAALSEKFLKVSIGAIAIGRVIRAGNQGNNAPLFLSNLAPSRIATLLVRHSRKVFR
jgi:hypothetical protein